MVHLQEWKCTIDEKPEMVMKNEKRKLYHTTFKENISDKEQALHKRVSAVESRETRSSVANREGVRLLSTLMFLGLSSRQPGGMRLQYLWEIRSRQIQKLIGATPPVAFCSVPVPQWAKRYSERSYE